MAMPLHPALTKHQLDPKFNQMDPLRDIRRKIRMVQGEDPVGDPAKVGHMVVPMATHPLDFRFLEKWLNSVCHNQMISLR